MVFCTYRRKSPLGTLDYPALHLPNTPCFFLMALMRCVAASVKSTKPHSPYLFRLIPPLLFLVGVNDGFNNFSQTILLLLEELLHAFRWLAYFRSAYCCFHFIILILRTCTLELPGLYPGNGADSVCGFHFGKSDAGCAYHHTIQD